MNLHKCILTENDCYKANRQIVPKGIMVHSTGCNNPNLRRYVQPDDGLLGVNTAGTSWNRSGVGACVHAFIGKLKDGTIATYQTLPFNWRGWHAGTGTSGKSANDTHISFEICEDGLNDKTYFDTVYKEAVEFTTYLCKQYNLDPLQDGVVICHSEGYKRGIASNHADVMHWFPKFGKNMDTFRQDVKTLLDEDEDEMTQEQFSKMMDTYLQEQAKLEPKEGGWSTEYRKWCQENGIFAGDEHGKMMWLSWITREQTAAIIKRTYDLLFDKLKNELK